jgi:hypothetical protein
MPLPAIRYPLLPYQTDGGSTHKEKYPDPPRWGLCGEAGNVPTSTSEYSDVKEKEDGLKFLSRKITKIKL